ncbi:Hypothetical predicted protein [Lecanosticta acicola]|uniref:Uncharacterized protein n=1 Tax=Lecanosticta acicola TaxID=111012 RepID=A0AAI9EF95_9PEZI|nr:Hypothetical predicted protein [Lecanosticta acicola]
MSATQIKTPPPAQAQAQAQAPNKTPTPKAVPRKPAAVPAAKKSAESLTGDSAAATAIEDTVKAIEKLEAKLTAINTNSVARVANSHITSADEALTPMVSLKTSKPLDKFPDTPKDIAKLTLVQINDLLTHLDTGKTGSEVARRERLRTQMGLKASPA